jgi:hypothetical protein
MYTTHPQEVMSGECHTPYSWNNLAVYYKTRDIIINPFRGYTISHHIHVFITTNGILFKKKTMVNSNVLFITDDFEL